MNYPTENNGGWSCIKFQKLLTHSLDQKFFKDFCKTVYNLNAGTTKAFCLGKNKGNNGENKQSQHRPLLVLLEKENDRDTLLACVITTNTKRFTLYKIKPNLKELSTRNWYADEMKQRRARGESNFIIRNGSIITKCPCSQSITNAAQSGSNIPQFIAETEPTAEVE